MDSGCLKCFFRPRKAPLGQITEGNTFLSSLFASKYRHLNSSHSLALHSSLQAKADGYVLIAINHRQLSANVSSIRVIIHSFKC